MTKFEKTIILEKEIRKDFSRYCKKKILITILVHVNIEGMKHW